MSSEHSRFSVLKRRRRAARRKADCQLCGFPIPLGLEISVAKKVYHADCAVTVVKESHGQQLDSSRGSEENNEGRTLDPADTFVN